MAGQATQPHPVLAIVRTFATTLRAAVIPIKDYNPTTRFAVVTASLIAINVLVYFGFQQRAGAQQRLSFERAAIPCEVVKQRPLSLVEIELTKRGISDHACGIAAPEGIANRPLF